VSRYPYARLPSAEAIAFQMLFFGNAISDDSGEHEKKYGNQ
jgi:hypothetical protein